jgi:putative DNA primase/helicase
MSAIEEARCRLALLKGGEPQLAPQPVRSAETGVWRKPPHATSVQLLRGDEVQMRPIPWLWNGYIAKGRLCVLAGRPGTGKTTVALALAATVTTGGRWPDGTRAELGNIAVWSGEDDPADTLAPRLALAGADLSRMHFVDGVRRAGARDAFDPSRDIEPLRRALADASGCKLLIVDPIVSAVAGDSHKNAEVRRGLQPLCELAGALKCALLGITHLSKATDGRDPTERLTGSLAFGALARTVLMTAKRTAGDGSVTRLLLRAKNNLGADDGGFEYDIEQGELKGAPGVFASRVVWGAAVEGDARELLAEAESTGDPDGHGADAEEFLREVLRDGPAPTHQVKADASGAGIAWRTVERAKKRLGVVVEKRGMKGGWAWRMPEPWEREDRHKTAKTATFQSGGLREKVAVFEPSDDVIWLSDEGGT